MVFFYSFFIFIASRPNEFLRTCALEIIILLTAIYLFKNDSFKHFFLSQLIDTLFSPNMEIIIDRRLNEFFP